MVNTFDGIHRVIQSELALLLDGYSIQRDCCLRKSSPIHAASSQKGDCGRTQTDAFHMGCGSKCGRTSNLPEDVLCLGSTCQGDFRRTGNIQSSSDLQDPDIARRTMKREGIGEPNSCAPLVQSGVERQASECTATQVQIVRGRTTCSICVGSLHVENCRTHFGRCGNSVVSGPHFACDK